MTGQVNDKVNELRTKLTEEITASLRPALLKEATSLVINESFAAQFRLLENKITEQLSNKDSQYLTEKVERLAVDNTLLNEELLTLKLENEQATISLDEAAKEIELLSEQLHHVSAIKLEEIKILEEQNVSLEKQMNAVSVTNKVYELLDYDIPLRAISKRLFECKTMGELDTIVELYNSSLSSMINESQSMFEEMLEVRTGQSFTHEELAAKESSALTEEQQEQRVLAGLDD